MLFPLSLETPQCQVLEILNNELLFFLRRSVSAHGFREGLFSKYQVNGDYFTSACWTNIPTRAKFHALWEALPTSFEERQEIYSLIQSSQDIPIYFSDVSTQLPILASARFFDALRNLTTHLYTRTKSLSDTVFQAGNSIGHHFQSFKDANNGSELCFLCGTARLSQSREGFDHDEQWRADYDHILCKDKYPIYSTHPGNLIPSCDICNSKAKGAQDLLRRRDGTRRIAFYPLPPSEESCHEYATVCISLSDKHELISEEWDSPLKPLVSFPTAPPEIISKIEVWSEVYQVPARVQHEILTQFYESIASDLLDPRNFEEFCSQLASRAENKPYNYKSREWSFWWHKVYEYLVSQSTEFLEDIWYLIAWKREQLDGSAIF